jgi:hypothetical protein
MGGGDLSAQAIIWGEIVGKAVGCKPFLYSNLSFFQTHLTNPDLPNLFRCWPAAWSANEPYAPSPFTHVDLWQNSSTAVWPGLPQVDEDTFQGSIDQLKALGKPGPYIPPSPPKPTVPIDYAAGDKIRHVQTMATGVHQADYHVRWVLIADWVQKNK